MPILHLKITDPIQDIELSQHINAQTLVLKKISAEVRGDAYAHKAGGTTNIIPVGQFEIEFPFFSGSEFVSNTNNQRIPFGFNHPPEGGNPFFVDKDYHMALRGENIPQRFVVKTFYYPTLTDLRRHTPSLVPAGKDTASPGDEPEAFAVGSGFPYCINVYFEYETNGVFF